MASPRRLVACAAALLASGARSRHMDIREVLNFGESLNLGESLICGGTRIRELIAGPQGEKQVRNINWDEAFNAADGYLKFQSSEIKKLEGEIRGLQQEILKKLQQELRPALDPEQIAASVVAAIASGYGSFDLARDTKCLYERPQGNPRLRSAEAWAVAVHGFSASINEILTNSKASVSSGDVRGECEKKLQVGDNSKNCIELCQQMADAAQKASDALPPSSPTGRSSDQLRQELEAKEDALRFATGERDACAQNKAEIEIFKEQIGAMNEDITDKHGRFMDANDAFFDAQEALEDVSESLQEQQKSTAAAMQVLVEAGILAKAAQSKFASATAKAEKVATAVAAANTLLMASAQELKTVEEANNILQQLKAAVSDTMLKLVLYFDEAVRRPVRKLGLGKETDVDSFFFKNVGAIVSAVDAKSSIKSLANFCSSKITKSALDAVSKPGQDMSILCVIGDVDDIEMDIDRAVTERVEHLQEGLHSVQSSLDPYQGQATMDDAVVDNRVEKGEPVGLREVISAFAHTTYYRNYLKEWKLKGKFIKLYAALSVALKKAQKQEKKATDQLDAVTKQLQVAAQAQTEAQNAFASDLKRKNDAQGQHEQAQQLLEQASAASAKLAQDLKALQEATEEARRRYEAAIASLLKMQQEHTSLIELLELLEED